MSTAEPTPEVSDPSDLYSLSIDQFTSARDNLAERLRSEGRTEEAERVGKLRKPSVAVWALNRAARLNPGQVDQLLDSHRRIREADSVAAMQAASESRRQAVTGLVEAAAAELAADGRVASLQTRDRINRTLLAVATDAQGEADLKAGCLVRELEPSGGGWGDIGLAPPTEEAPSQKAARAAEKARALAEKLETEAVEAEGRLEAAKQAVTEARRGSKAARAAADQAAGEAEEAEKAARDLGG